MRPTSTHLTVVAILFAATIAAPSSAKDLPEPSFASRQKLPPLPQGLTWLNSTGPIELSDLRGKFVLFDFWTYCCINCMHILPELNKLEHAYPKNLVVIGVHSAKFNTERDSDNITEAIQRYKIEHPVINDSQHILWDLFGVNVWPTVVLVDPEGYAIWGTTGEVTFEQVDRVMKQAVNVYRKKKLLDESPLSFNAARKADRPTPLRYPGKILADEAGGRLFIADSNYNRIVVAKLDGTLIETIGTGQPGMKDGSFATATFKQPQGMALDRERLYVADTENHAIRRIDLTARTVITIAGTGKQARDPPSMIRHVDPLRTALSSPWDVAIQSNTLYVAMAGFHEIWRMRLESGTTGAGTIVPYAGNAREDIIDGPLLPTLTYELGASSFAQPSGLASDGTWLYVADSEGSSIRAVPLKSHTEVRTVVGTAGLPTARLFTFGDVDGPAQLVRLQHPLGLAYARGKLYVADTYNHKIKAVDPADGSTTTLAGLGKPGMADEPAAFREPAGLSAAAGKLYIADTNNHRICCLDLATNRVETLPIVGLKPPVAVEQTMAESDAEVQALPLTSVRAQRASLHLQVRLAFPAGYHIDPLAPVSYQIDPVESATEGVVDRHSLGKKVRVEKPAANFDVRLPLSKTEGSDALRVRVEFYYCRVGANGICKAASAVWSVPLKIDPSAQSDVVTVRYRAP